MATPKTNRPNAADETKVFDVAKPGSSDPETGTKPMVIGSRTMSYDPSMIEPDQKNETDSKDTDSTEPTITLSPSKKLTLQPLDSVTASGRESSIDTEESMKDKDVAEGTAGDESDSSEDREKQKTTDEIEKEHQVEVDEREQKLGELIKSGEYNVIINESKALSPKVFLTTFLLTGILVITIVVILIDLEIVDLGLSLPFDVL